MLLCYVNQLVMMFSWLNEKKMILIYEDDGVSLNCLKALESFINENFSQYLNKRTNSENIIKDLSFARLLIIPGGRDLAYCEKLNGLKNEKIKEFIAQGGAYLGVCAGAYYASASIHFTGEGYRIIENRELSLHAGEAIGSIPELTNGIYFNEHSSSKAVAILDNEAACYYHGGCYFLNVEDKRKQIKYTGTNNAAIVYGDYFKGKYLLSGVHFEVTKKRYEKFQINEEGCDLKIEEEIMKNLPEHDEKWIIEMIKRVLFD